MLATIQLRIFLSPIKAPKDKDIQSRIFYLLLCMGGNLISRFVSENEVLRGIFGPKREEVTGEWRKVHKGLS
jgi:hypothetical protein